MSVFESQFFDWISDILCAKERNKLKMTAKQLATLLMNAPENSEVYVCGELSRVYMGVMTPVQNAAIYTGNALDMNNPFTVLIAPALDEEEYCDFGGKERRDSSRA